MEISRKWTSALLSTLLTFGLTACGGGGGSSSGNSTNDDITFD